MAEKIRRKGERKSVKYLGGKTRIAKEVSQIINSVGGVHLYPFSAEVVR